MERSELVELTVSNVIEHINNSRHNKDMILGIAKELVLEVKGLVTDKLPDIEFEIWRNKKGFPFIIWRRKG